MNVGVGVDVKEDVCVCVPDEVCVLDWEGDCEGLPVWVNVGVELGDAPTVRDAVGVCV